MSTRTYGRLSLGIVLIVMVIVSLAAWAQGR
jgi:hypothetical protein